MSRRCPVLRRLPRRILRRGYLLIRRRGYVQKDDRRVGRLCDGFASSPLQVLHSPLRITWFRWCVCPQQSPALALLHGPSTRATPHGCTARDIGHKRRSLRVFLLLLVFANSGYLQACEPKPVDSY